MPESPLNILVLAGGPDRERDVSLLSGRTIADALKQAGHRVTQGDLRPDDTSALDAFVDAGGDVVFPALHGPWGEGGGAQAILTSKGVPFVGCQTDAATLCMSKSRTKAVLKDQGIPMPVSELVPATDTPTLTAPVVLKPDADGSSIDLAICPDTGTLATKWALLVQHNDELLVEQFIAGKEVTVGWIDGNALPPIWIQPATAFYDYDAKYQRDDTRYVFDLNEPTEVTRKLQELTEQACAALNVRHLARADYMLDVDHQPWLLEVNTMPGFTSHSLLPMAARQAGIETPQLCDRLVRMALRDV